MSIFDGNRSAFHQKGNLQVLSRSVAGIVLHGLESGGETVSNGERR